MLTTEDAEDASSDDKESFLKAQFSSSLFVPLINFTRGLGVGGLKMNLTGHDPPLLMSNAG